MKLLQGLLFIASVISTQHAFASSSSLIPNSPQGFENGESSQALRRAIEEAQRELQFTKDQTEHYWLSRHIAGLAAVLEARGDNRRSGRLTMRVAVSYEGRGDTSRGRLPLELLAERSMGRDEESSDEEFQP